MKNTFIGAIGPFDPKVCQFPGYISRFKQFLMVNEVPESKHSIFFTVMGNMHFQLLANLVVPKSYPTERRMSFDECVSMLTDHFHPATLEVVEQQTFFNCKHSAEDTANIS
ncbi:hypothetical protein T10_12724 [Trichinella papuae]|uniref:Uncharacterized protein n=1 Tax=Trichinella papuae TaxID=268474 RepID=A0A0V1MVK5_9BILA|nr:hypothetical protein T10_12724 [Trichinella papuae]